MLESARVQIDGVVDTLVKAGHASSDTSLCLQLNEVIGELEWLRALLGDLISHE